MGKEIKILNALHIESKKYHNLFIYPCSTDEMKQTSFYVESEKDNRKSAICYKYNEFFEHWDF